MPTLTLTSSHTNDTDTEALAFAQAHHQWLRLSGETHSWTDPERQRSLAVAFLNFHAAKLALTESISEQAA